MSCLILRAYLKTTYRGVLDVLAASASLRQCLGLDEELPHFTTLQRFSARTHVLAIAQKLVGVIGQQAARQAGDSCELAMDATGLARTTVSDYFCSRRGRRLRRWVKVSAVVLCGSLLPVALVVDLNPTHDCAHARQLLAQTRALTQPARLFADAGYDAEWIHVECREKWVWKVSSPRSSGERTEVLVVNGARANDHRLLETSRSRKTLGSGKLL